MSRSAIVIVCRLSVSLCRLSVKRVYCDKMAVLGSCSFQQNVAQCLISLLAKFYSEIQRESPWSGGSNWGGVVFDRVRDAISRKRCEIERRWQLITNRKSYMCFRLQHKSMTLNDLEWPWTSIHCSVVSFIRVATKWLKLESRGFVL